MRALLLCAVLLIGCAPSRTYTFDRQGPPAYRRERLAAENESREPHFLAELLRELAGFIPGVGIH